MGGRVVAANIESPFPVYLCRYRIARGYGTFGETSPVQDNSRRQMDGIRDLEPSCMTVYHAGIAHLAVKWCFGQNDARFLPFADGSTDLVVNQDAHDFRFLLQRFITDEGRLL